MSLDLCMTARKDDASPIGSIFYHKRPLKGHKNHEDAIKHYKDSAIKDHENALKNTKRPIQDMQGCTMYKAFIIHTQRNFLIPLDNFQFNLEHFSILIRNTFFSPCNIFLFDLEQTRVMAVYGGLPSWTGTLWGPFPRGCFYFEAKCQ